MIHIQLQYRRGIATERRSIILEGHPNSSTKHDEAKAAINEFDTEMSIISSYQSSAVSSSYVGR